MSTEVAKKEKNAVQVVDFTAKATEYLTAMGLQLPDKHKKMFVELSQAYGLNPFKREIYAVGYGNNFNVITGYEVYLKRAERTGLLDGYETNWEEDANGSIKSCTCTVYRKDRQHPTKQKVYFSEYNLGTAIWKSKPHTMIEKVAIAQAFRKAFPDELGGMPYTAEEMSDNNVVEVNAEVIATNTIPTQQTVQQHQPVQTVQAQGQQQVKPQPHTEPTVNEKIKVNEFIKANNFEEATKEINLLKAKYPNADFKKMDDVLQAKKDEFAMAQNAQATTDEAPF